MDHPGKSRLLEPQVKPEFQLAFLSKLQRLFAEGDFTATYKFALLIALADLSVELGHDDNERLKLPYRSIGLNTSRSRRDRKSQPSRRQVTATLRRTPERLLLRRSSSGFRRLCQTKRNNRHDDEHLDCAWRSDAPGSLNRQLRLSLSCL